MITTEAPDRAEVLRYLGGADAQPDERLTALLDSCEKELLRIAEPKYLYRMINLPCDEWIAGEDIRAHLRGCDRAILLCATLGMAVDRTLRVTQIKDMSRAVVLDSMANVLIEQVCDKAERLIAAQLPDCHLTFRYSPGYGDYPIAMQKKFLEALDAPRKIGLSRNGSDLLTPSKSVTAIIGVSKEPVERRRRGCAVCNLRETCRYRRRGNHCGFENTSQ